MINEKPHYIEGESHGSVGRRKKDFKGNILPPKILV